MRFYLVLHAKDGTRLPNEVVELEKLPSAGTAIKPPVSSRPCFVTSALPASIHATGDVRIAGTVYADVVD